MAASPTLKSGALARLGLRFEFCAFAYHRLVPQLCFLAREPFSSAPVLCVFGAGGQQLWLTDVTACADVAAWYREDTLVRRRTGERNYHTEA